MKQKIILATLALGVVALFVTGIVNWKWTVAWGRRLFYQGRSQVVRATDFRTQPLNDVQAATQCRANLRLLENAKRKVAQERGMAVGRLTERDIVAEMPGKAMPRCPGGGEYILGDIGTMPKCTIAGNRTARPEDDHIVINY